jgi:hypothetical protein
LEAQRQLLEQQLLEQQQQQQADLKAMLEQERAQQQAKQQQAQQQAADLSMQTQAALHRAEQAAAAAKCELEQSMAAATTSMQRLSAGVPPLSAQEHAVFRGAAAALQLILSRAAAYVDVQDPACGEAICDALAQLPFWAPDQRPTSCADCQVDQSFALVEQVGAGVGVWGACVGSMRVGSAFTCLQAACVVIRCMYGLVWFVLTDTTRARMSQALVGLIQTQHIVAIDFALG